MENTKICNICREVKELDEFYKHPNGRYGRQARCISCSKAYSKKNLKRFRGKNTKRKQKERWHKDFGMTEFDYLEMFRKQNGKCAICGVSHLELKKILSVDHCHETGKVRGLLCTDCNFGIGHLKDNPKIVELAAEYLRKHEALVKV